MEQTSIENKALILADLWMNFRADEQFEDFAEYNDLGLPLAYAVANSIVPMTDKAKSFIEETFDLLLAGLEVGEDTGFETLDDILGYDVGGREYNG
jgi:hypothetical protein